MVFPCCEGTYKPPPQPPPAGRGGNGEAEAAPVWLVGMRGAARDSHGERSGGWWNLRAATTIARTQAHAGTAR